MKSQLQQSIKQISSTSSDQTRRNLFQRLLSRNKITDGADNSRSIAIILHSLKTLHRQQIDSLKWSLLTFAASKAQLATSLDAPSRMLRDCQSFGELTVEFSRFESTRMSAISSQRSSCSSAYPGRIDAADDMNGDEAKEASHSRSISYDESVQ